MLPESAVGVVIGRFQVDQLHEGHQWLLKEVFSRHKNVLILLGVSPLPSSPANPLSFEMRKSIIEDFSRSIPSWEAPVDLQIEVINDHPSDEVWSKNVDFTIRSYCHDRFSVYSDAKAVLYGARDSFAKYYSGDFLVHVFTDMPVQDSGTRICQQILSDPHHASMARGAIWSAVSQFPTVYSTVDAAVLRPAADFSGRHELLVGLKKGHGGYCFPGGFADPSSASDEEDAIREVKEETGLDVRVSAYLGSFPIDDWRYRSEPHSIRTRFFLCVPTNRDQEIVAADDLDEARWVYFDELQLTDFATNHRVLHRGLWNHLNYLHN